MATRPYIGPTHSRAGLLPTGGTTIHAIGDTHCGPTGVAAWRLDAIHRDTHAARTPAPAAVVQLGDCTNDTPVQDTPHYTAFMGRFEAPAYAVMGNHDVFAQTPAQWASSMGYASDSYTVDLPDVRLVMWGTSDTWVNYEYVSPGRLAWLDAAIGGTTKPVIVFCHIPLFGTVGMATPSDAHSRMIPYYLRTADDPASSVDVLNVLAAHANLKAFVSGHTHSSIHAADSVKAVTHNGHRFAAISAASPYSTTTVYPYELGNQCVTAYLTWLGDRVEVRYRDHGAGQWAAPNGNLVLTVTGLG